MVKLFFIIIKKYLLRSIDLVSWGGCSSGGRWCGGPPWRPPVTRPPPCGRGRAGPRRQGRTFERRPGSSGEDGCRFGGGCLAPADAPVAPGELSSGPALRSSSWKKAGGEGGAAAELSEEKWAAMEGDRSETVVVCPCCLVCSSGLQMCLVAMVYI